EGGFHGEEEAELLRAGFQPVTLGPRRLRSEAAAFAAITLLLGSLAAG
ncbi:MAG TPA: 16S rRNA (uracil(1498)-N(3))-methyltransferase, partial [Bacteroidetes bacterium]|nr:16S rRNA (uracil(1498)-N(3))-methyltransferase [Bacteroidota bacterium]